MDTDYDRWYDSSTTWGSKNPERAHVVGDIVNSLALKFKNPNLLDLGCGSMILKKFINSEILYKPADIHKRSPECEVLDINKGKYPIDFYDIICVVGVIEYFCNPEEFFKKISTQCTYLVCTYSISENFPSKVEHWLNHLSKEEFLALVTPYFIVEEYSKLFNGQIIFVLSNKNYAQINKPMVNNYSLLQERASWSFKDISNNFDNHIASSVPLYHESRHLASCFTDFLIKTNSTVIDIGCSTGTFLKSVAARHSSKSDLSLLGIDCEESMIEKCILENNDPRIEYLCQDVINYDFEDSIQLISSFYTLQFIHPRFRQYLVDKIYKSLDWGGAFILAEKVRATDARFQDWITDLYHEFKFENGFANEAIRNKQLALRGILEPFSTTENRSMLSRAGFKDIICISKYLCFETLLAVK